MPKLMKSYKMKELPIKQDSINILQFMYKKKKGFDNNDIEATAKKLQQGVLAKLAESGMENYDAQMMITNLYDKSIGWQSGRFTDFGDDVNFYDFANEYEYEGDRIQDTFNRVNILVKLIKKEGGCDGKMNDCLFYALRDGLNVEMPKRIKDPYHLKRYVKVARYDLVPVSVLPMLEKKMKVRINVIGDVEIMSAAKHKETITVKLSNSHYTLHNRHKIDKQLRGGTNYRDKTIIMYEEDYVGGKLKYVAYDGKQQYEIDRSILNVFWMKPLSSKVIYRRRRPDQGTLEEQHQQMVSDAHELAEHSKGKINLFRQLNEKKAALFLFGKLSNTFAPPEPIGELEARWIRNAKSGGLIWAERCELEDAYCYDMNKMYSSLLKNDRFTVPTGKGVFSTLSQAEVNKAPYFAYGIYHCRISNPNNIDTRLFSYSKRTYYTHFDLTTAKALGLSIEIVGGSNNVLLYPKRVHSHHLFAPFVEFMDGVYKKCSERGRKRCKLIMNALWGGLSMANDARVDLNESRELDLKDREVVHVEPYKKSFLVNVQCYTKRFKTDYARIGAFLPAYGRRVMFQQLQKHYKNIKRVHTDGFISQKKLKMDVGTEIGQWKVEHQGKCSIHSAVRVEWS